MQNRSIDGAAYCRQATDGATSIKIGISFTNNNKQIISTYKKNILKVRNTWQFFVKQFVLVISKLNYVHLLRELGVYN